MKGNGCTDETKTQNIIKENSAHHRLWLYIVFFFDTATGYVYKIYI